MGLRNINKKFGNRFAEEMQLAAEERWILDALNKIKKQRNCLQIERLQLESLKVRNATTATSEAKSQKTNANETCPLSTSEQSSTLDIMQSKRPTLDLGKSSADIKPHHNFEMDCNMEELNLLVSTPDSKPPLNMDFCTEEEESDDDVSIDINMLMNGIEDGM